MLLLIISVLIFFTALRFYLLYRRNFSYWSRYNVVPSVRGRIFSGDFLQFATLKTHFGFHMKNIYDDPKFSNESVVGVYGLYKPSLLIRDQQLLKSILIKDFDCFPTFMEGLVAQAGIFMVGGYETSASAISNALMELAKHPQLQQILRAEILDAFVDGDDEISYEAINKMEYLDMVIHETMRLYPVLTYLERKYERPAGRKTPYTLRPHYDFDLPEGMPIYISVYSLHYDERYWPNPKKFDPERFAPGNREKMHPLTYLPFGEGLRNCIGNRLGMLQVKIALVYFLKNHYVQVCDRTTMNPEFDARASVLQIKGGI